jgi:glycerol-3-phosphate dehydrogenase
MSHTEGLNAIERALRYVEQEEDTTPADLLLQRCLQNIAAKKRGTAIKQKTVKVSFMKV